MRTLTTSTCIAAIAVASIAISVRAETNTGTIAISNTNGAVGMTAAAGASGTIVNSATGKIIVDETYTPTDSDNDGDLDGPFATGSNRFGIRTAGAFTGDVTNNGAITIEGNDSAGIAFGGPLTGKLTTDGTITVTGDRSIGVRTGDMTGPVRIAGTISAKGKDAMAASIEGNINGPLVVQGSLTATGYRSTTPPADTSKLDADDLLQGGPALSIAGDVSGGIILAIPPKDTSSTDNDEDHDGIDDSKEGSAAVTSLGSAPAVRIGGTSGSVTIGAVAGNGNGHGLVIDGTVLGAGTYAGIDGNGIMIGGLGGTVAIAGGITINGKVQATSNGANATAIRIGNGATVPEIRNAGTIDAAGGSAAAIAIDAGANILAIRNSGQISATASASSGSAIAIVDHGGLVTAIDNSGAISGKTAIDLSANSSGTTIRQTVVASGIAAPSIKGDILFGSGSDLLDIADGGMTGAAKFGAGANRFALSGDATYAGAAQFGAGDDTLTLAGSSTFTGGADFGGGTDSLTLTGTSHFTGTLANSAGLAVALTGGTLDLDKGTIALRSLAVGAQGVLGVTLDASNHSSTIFQVSGDASFVAGSKVALKLTGVIGAEGRYTFLQAGTITGGSALGASNTVLPFLFKSGIVATTPTTLAIDITRKTAAELGLNRSQASAYNAIYQALGKDVKVAGVFLDIADGDRFRKQLRQMLPDHAGGAFEAVTMGSRATASFLADPNAPFADQGRWGYWIQQVGVGTSKSLGDTASYDVYGWGISTGAEIKSRFGGFGVSLAYLYDSDADGGTDNKVDANQYEAALYWRGSWGPLSAHARGSIAQVDFKGTRKFEGSIGTENVERIAKGSWNGRMVSAAAGVSYELYFGPFSLRPAAAVDYYKLREGGYSETGGGDAFNLTVDSRTSDELALSGTIAAGIEFGGADKDSGWVRIEAEAGRRELVGGSLGSTTAHFTGGSNFTLLPEERTSGWVGKLRAVGGGNGFRIGGEASAEQQQGRAALALRANLMVGF